MEKTLAVNAGSSSLKWQLYEMPEEVVIAKGILSGLVCLVPSLLQSSMMKRM